MERRKLLRGVSMAAVVAPLMFVEGCGVFNSVGTSAGNAIATQIISEGQSLITSVENAVTGAGVTLSTDVTNGIANAQSALTTVSSAFANNVISTANSLVTNLTNAITTAAQVAGPFLAKNTSATSILNDVVTYAPQLITLAGKLLGTVAAPPANVAAARAAAGHRLGIVV